MPRCGQHDNQASQADSSLDNINNEANDDAASEMHSVALGGRPSAARWEEVREWVRTSYTMVAPKALARQVLVDDGLVDD